MVINMIVLGVLQIATIYSRTFSQFLAVRSLFGLFMGGVYGNAIAMALEHCPYVFPLFFSFCLSLSSFLFLSYILGV